MASGLSRREQWALLLTVAVILLTMGIGGFHSPGGHGDEITIEGQGRWVKLGELQADTPTTPTRPMMIATSPNLFDSTNNDAPASGLFNEHGQLDLNAASANDLTWLPEIGPARAEAILQVRDQLGGFRSVDQLDAVSGIGEKRLARLRPLVFVAPTTPTTPSEPMPGLASAPPTEAQPAAGQAEAPLRIDINQATAEELQQIKGVGPVLAGRIIEDRRRHGPYRRAEDLLRVKGIGPVSLERMRPAIVIH